MSGSSATTTLTLVEADSLRNRRVIRYAVGVTAAMTLAVAVAWPLAFICPVLVGLLLSLPAPLTLRNGAAFVALVAVAMGLSFVASALLLPYPEIFLAVLALVLFQIFHAASGTTNPLFVLWLVVGFCATPLVMLESTRAGWMLTVSFTASAAVAVVLTFLAQTLMPDPPCEAPTTAARPLRPVPDRKTRIRNAAIGTLTVWPLLAAFMALNLTGDVTIVLYAAVMAITADLRAGVKWGLAFVVANIGGAAVTLVIYNLVVAVTDLAFLAALVLLTTLALGRRKFSDNPTASLYSTALNGILIITAESTTYAVQAGAKITTRLGQMILAVVYIVIMFDVLQGLWKGKER